MASYAAFAAVLFRRWHSLPLLISLADQRLEDLPYWMRVSVRFFLRGADQISASSLGQEGGVTRMDPKIRLTMSNRQGDAFANQIRFLYNELLNRTIE
jgi:hypothetical protein